MKEFWIDKDGNFYSGTYTEGAREATQEEITAHLNPTPTLEELKAEAWERIKAKRDALEQAGVPYMDKVLDSDPVSVQRITIAVQAAQTAIAAGVEFSISWTMQDNSVLLMTAQEICGMPAALAMYSNKLHEIARELRERIEAAKNMEALEAIVWPEEAEDE